MFSRRIVVRIIVGAALWVCPLSPFSSGFFANAEAAETIKDFSASIEVHPDGQVDVIEAITVNAENNQIRHGIYRDIPTRYTDKMGNLISVPFFIKSIQRDSGLEPYHVEYLGNGIRIYIGHKEKNVTYGIHRYTLHYAVNRVIGFFPTGDELYWNVTGNGWEFPIERASVRLAFPSKAQITQFAAYTGVQGARGQDFYQHVVGNIYAASTTRILNPKEGFTVFAAVPVGNIQQETVWQNIYFFLHDNATWLVFLASVLVLLGYLFLAWRRVGVDTAGVIIPRFDIPEGIAPDMLRFIYKQAYDDKVFSCLFLQSAVEKFLKIEDRSSSVLLERLKDLPMDTQTGKGLGVLGLLFMEQSSISIPKRAVFSRNRSEGISERLLQAKVRHKIVLEKDKEKFYSDNQWVIYGAGVISVLSLGLCFYLSVTDAQRFVTISLFMFAHIFLISAFSKPMKKYTFLGQDMADYAAGLRLYLSVAEEARMNKLYPKTVTPETFETMLPYALALDVEQEWCDHFAALVAAGQVAYYDNQRDDGLGWYHSSRGLNLAQLGHSLTSLSGTISSATTAPGRSSGSSGSSGGGGGGGGGGGW